MSAVILFSVFGIPIIAAEDTEDDLVILAEHGLIVELDTDTVIYEKAADELVFCGFLPRLMTCILLVEADRPLDTLITVHSKTNSLTPQVSSANIHSGDLITLGDLMNAVLVANSQEAAVAIALYLSDGDINDFLKTMNSRAAQLGATSTVFRNVTGYYSKSDLSLTTVSDISIIACHAISLDYILNKSNQRYVDLTVNGKTRKIYTKNNLIDSGTTTYMKQASGLAISGTQEAGSAMVSMISDKNLKFVSVAVSSSSVSSIYTDITAMLKYSLNEYKVYTVIKKNEPYKEIKVLYGKDRDYITVAPNNDIYVSLPRRADESDIVVDIQGVPDTVEAPVTKGDVIGTLEISYNGRTQTVDLIAQTGVDIDLVDQFSEQLKSFFSNRYFWATIIILILLIIFYIILVYLANTKKRRRQQSEKKDRIKFN